MIVISDLKREDIPAFAVVDAAAMERWPITAVWGQDSIQQGFTSRQKHIEHLLYEEFDKPDPNSWWLKATDEESGKLVAAACWRRVVPHTQRRSATTDHPEASVQKSLWAAMQEQWTSFEETYFAGQDYYKLQVLFTHPDWQRQGIGSTLVEYGCSRADREGLIAVLHASPAGLGLYLKHGFSIAYQKQFDCRPYGIDHSELRTGLIRNPTRV